MTGYIVVWKDQPGQQVSTVVNDANLPAYRTLEYIEQNNIPVIADKDTVFSKLADADGVKFALSSDLARETLGWDV